MNINRSAVAAVIALFALTVVSLAFAIVAYDSEPPPSDTCAELEWRQGQLNSRALEIAELYDERYTDEWASYYDTTMLQIGELGTIIDRLEYECSKENN